MVFLLYVTMWTDGSKQFNYSLRNARKAIREDL